MVISHYCKLEERDLVELGLEIIVGFFSSTEKKTKKCYHYEYRILIACICSVTVFNFKQVEADDMLLSSA